MIAVAAQRTQPPPASLFAFARDQAVRAIEADRTQLLARIERLKPRSTARIIAEDRLRTITHRSLEVSTGSGDDAPGSTL